MKELIEKIRDELSDGGVMVAPYWADLLKDSADTIESQAATIALYETTAENYELLQAKVDEQAREIEGLNRLVDGAYTVTASLMEELSALKAQPSGVVLPPSPYTPGVEPAQLSEYERGEAQGRCDMWAEVARLNSSPGSADTAGSKETE